MRILTVPVLVLLLIPRSAVLRAQETSPPNIGSPARATLSVELGSFTHVGLPFDIPYSNPYTRVSGAPYYGARASIRVADRIAVVSSVGWTRPIWRLTACGEGCAGGGVWRDKINLLLYDAGVRVTILRSAKRPTNTFFVEAAGGQARQRVGNLQLTASSVHTGPSIGVGLGGMHHLGGGFSLTARVEDRFIRFTAPVDGGRLHYRPNVLASAGLAWTIY